jgi:hypothetical protein
VKNEDCHGTAARRRRATHQHQASITNYALASQPIVINAVKNEAYKIKTKKPKPKAIPIL